MKNLSDMPTMRKLLGKRFDTDIARIFGLTNVQVKRYRESLGIPKACRACALALSKGRPNTCPHHSDVGREAAAAASEAFEEERADAEPFDWEAARAELRRLTREVRRREDELDLLLCAGREEVSRPPHG